MYSVYICQILCVFLYGIVTKLCIPLFLYVKYMRVCRRLSNSNHELLIYFTDYS